MLNHWIPAVPAVGDAQPGHRRARSCARGSGACERQREMLPNLLAVDFYERTGVAGIARDLNAEQP